MGTIYKITNNLNNKIYIGKTIREPEIRWAEHKRDSQKENNKNILLYKAFNKYGIENFTFSIIEDNINEELLDEKEIYYINLYNSTSHQNGYNISLGGTGGKTTSKLTKEIVDSIIEKLEDVNNIQSFNELGKTYNISGSVIQRINIGETWYNPNKKYPLRKHSITKITLNRDIYSNIIKDIQDNIPFNIIQKKYNISEEQMTSINYGKYCYNNSLDSYYYGIYKGSFPIKNNKKEILIENSIVDIFYEVLFTKNSMEKIGLKYGIKGNTLTYIINGKRQKELTKDFITPMRKNLEENKAIFSKLFPNYERRSD